MKTAMMVLLCIMAMASMASANIAGYTISFNDNYSGGTGISHVLSVPQFDSSLGTLQSVKIDFGISATGWVGMENKNATTGGDKTLYTFMDDTHASHGVLQLKSGASTLSSVDWSVANTYIVSLAAFDGTVDYAGASGWKSTYLDKSDGGSALYDSGLESYIGNGTVNFDLVSSSTGYLFGDSQVSTRMSTTGAGDVTITYSYIPEPATLAILGLGGLLLRRRK